MSLKRNVVFTLIALAAVIALMIFVRKGSLARMHTQRLATRKIVSHIIVRDADEKHEVRLRFPLPGIEKCLQMDLIKKSCGCIEGYGEIDGDGVPTAILSMKIPSTRETKEVSSVFSARTSNTVYEFEVRSRVDVYPPFWSTLDRAMTIQFEPGETVRSIHCTASWVYPEFRKGGMAVRPLSDRLTIRSFSSFSEQRGDIWIYTIDSVVDVLAPVIPGKTVEAGVEWSSPFGASVRFLQLKIQDGISCRPARLFVTPTQTEDGGWTWSGKFVLSSTGASARVSDVACADADVKYVGGGSFAHQQEIVVSLSFEAVDMPRTKIVITMEGDRGMVESVVLPVFLLRGKAGD